MVKDHDKVEPVQTSFVSSDSAKIDLAKMVYTAYQKKYKNVVRLTPEGKVDIPFILFKFMGHINS